MQDIRFQVILVVRLYGIHTVLAQAWQEGNDRESHQASTDEIKQAVGDNSL